MEKDKYFKKLSEEVLLHFSDRPVSEGMEFIEFLQIRMLKISIINLLGKEGFESAEDYYKRKFQKFL